MLSRSSGIEHDVLGAQGQEEVIGECSASRVTKLKKIASAVTGPYPGEEDRVEDWSPPPDKTDPDPGTPMVVVHVQRTSTSITCLPVARPHPSPPLYHHPPSPQTSVPSFDHPSPHPSSSLSHHPFSYISPPSYDASPNSSPPLSHLHSPHYSAFTCHQVPEVPMVALECGLPLSGRLSPPADLRRSMSAPFLSSVNGVAAESSHDITAASPSTGNSSVVCSGHTSSLAAVSVQSYSNGVSRIGSKRKLSRREDAICEEEDVQSDFIDSNGVSNVSWGRGQEGEEGEEGVSERKRRRLNEIDEEQSFTQPCDVNSADPVNSVDAEDEAISVVDNCRNDVQEEQVISCALEDSVDSVISQQSSQNIQPSQPPSLDTVLMQSPLDNTSLQPSSFDSEITVNVVVDSPDSVVEVDVVGDDGEDAPSPLHHPYPSVICHQENPTDMGHCSSEEASSEDGEDSDAFLMTPRPPRISPFLNTPKQRKEERRKILKMSIHKMRAVEDPEHFLRRSVLINNTMKRLQRELREEKMRNNPRRSCYGLYRRASSLHYDVLNNSYLLHDEPFSISENDRITDDMTDSLVTRLEATSSPVVPTPSPSPCPTETADTLEFPTSSEATWCSDVTSTVPELSSHLTTPDCVPESSMTASISQPTLDSLTSTSDDMMSLSCPVSSSSSSSTSSTVSSSTLYEGMFSVPSLSHDSQSPSSSCSSQSQREKQLYADIDTVFNNLIHALGDS